MYNTVKQAADAKGLTLADVERQAGIGNGTISKWKTSMPRVDTLAKVCEILDLDQGELVRCFGKSATE